MDIKILGSECCANCDAQMQIVKSALEKTGQSANLEKIEDMMEVVKYGVMSTPAIVINGEVKSRGRILNEHDVIELLKEYE